MSDARLAEPAETVISAGIARKTCIRAVYNRVNVVLAPHSLFEKHDELYLRAVTIEHGDRKPREMKLGTFKLSGLTEVERTKRLFSASTLFAGLLEDEVRA